MTKLNVLMLNYEFPPIGGGAANAHLQLLKQYSQMPDLRVDVLTSAAQTGFFTENFSDNVTIYKVGLHKKSLHFWRKNEVIEWLIKAPRYYRKLLSENDYDLVHAFFAFPSGWLCYRSKNKLPFIISLRGSDVPGKHARLQIEYKLLAPVFKSIWKNAAGIVACSNGLKERAHRFMPDVTIDVIPNGVDLERFHPAENKKTNETIRLLTVGRLSVTKRVELLIEAVEILYKTGLNITFTIVGEGAQADMLKTIVEQKTLTDVINFAGRVESAQMPEIYRRNDIYISATMQEGMSNAMLEAMACGLPIVTTRCEGLEELITDNGIVIDEVDSSGIAQAIKKLADNPELYRQMSLSSLEQAKEFTWEQATQQYIAQYERILARQTRCAE